MRLLGRVDSASSRSNRLDTSDLARGGMNLSISCETGRPSIPPRGACCACGFWRRSSAYLPIGPQLPLVGEWTKLVCALKASGSRIDRLLTNIVRQDDCAGTSLAIASAIVRQAPQNERKCWHLLPADFAPLANLTSLRSRRCRRSLAESHRHQDAQEWSSDFDDSRAHLIDQVEIDLILR